MTYRGETTRVSFWCNLKYESWFQDSKSRLGIGGDADDQQLRWLIGFGARCCAHCVSLTLCTTRCLRRDHDWQFR